MIVNKIKYFLTICSLLVWGSMMAQTPKLSYGKNGKFKIVQFSDMHWRPAIQESEEAIVAMNEVLDKEKPDFVFFTGDHVTGHPVKAGLDVIFQPVIDRKIPFAMVLGNHDSEYGMTNEEIIDYLKNLPGNMTSVTPGISGTPNFSIPIYTKEGRVGFVLYGLDSHTGAIDGFQPDQIAWYEAQSDAYTLQNGGRPVPSFVFFHIPLPEYQIAMSDSKSHFYGVRKEAIAPQKRNHGFYKSALRKNDVIGYFCGHDHLNDFVVSYNDGPLMCYARVTGSRKTSHYNVPNGSNGGRVIEITEGQPGFETWIRLRTGEKIQYVKFPSIIFRLDN